MNYLPVPQGVDFNTLEGFLQLFPPKSGMDEIQLMQYDLMVEQFNNNEPYNWSGSHGGSVFDNWFRGWHILKDKGSDGVYCCGLSLENWLRVYQDWMGDLAESELDLTLEQMSEVKAFFFVYTNKERTDTSKVAGGAKAMSYVGKCLQERWLEASQKSPDDYSSYEDDIGLRFRYHTNPYEAKFGAYVQLQSKPSAEIVKGSGGHAGIFLGLERRGYKGNQYDAVRILQANSSNDYAMKFGVNVGWFKIGKIHKATNFERIFHFGEMEPIE